MVRNLIIIPSSIYVTNEMHLDVGKIPPVMIPLNGKILLNQIISSYDSLEGENHFVILVNEGKEMIKSRIDKFVNDKINLIEVESPGLGGVIYEALEKLNLDSYDNLIINFGDTLVYSEFNKEKDAVFYKDLQESFRWTIFEEKDGRIINIIDKQKSDFDYSCHVLIGAFFMKDPKRFFESLKRSTNEEDLDRFYSALQHYLANTEYYSLIKADKWYDFGHIDYYQEAKKDFLNKRLFNKINIDKNKSILEKRSSDEEKLIDEMNWYLNMPPHLRYLIPQIYEHSSEKDNVFVKMEYYGYPSLAEVYLFSTYQIGVWSHILNSLFFILKEMRSHKGRYGKDEINKNMFKMYHDKTTSRLNEIRSKSPFKELFSNSLIINNKSYHPIDYYLDRIKGLFDHLIRDSSDSFSIIHGDFCLANILYDPKNRIVKLVDPRGKFGDLPLYGDYRYELAKLSHSFNGHYESIINDSFSLKLGEKSISYNLHVSKVQEKISDMFNRSLKADYSKDENAIKFIEAMLFLSMVPLHNDFLDRQIVMLATGVEKIDSLINNLQNL